MEIVVLDYFFDVESNPYALFTHYEDPQISN